MNLYVICRKDENDNLEFATSGRTKTPSCTTTLAGAKNAKAFFEREYTKDNGEFIIIKLKVAEKSTEDCPLELFKLQQKIQQLQDENSKLKSKITELQDEMYWKWQDEHC